MRPRDQGLRLALQKAGGVHPLARLLLLKQQSVQKWETIPQARLFDVGRAVGLSPEILRPDLEGWILAERGRQRLAAARERFSLVKSAVCAPDDPAADGLVTGMMIDFLVTLTAVRFVAQERELSPAHVQVGRRRVEMGARAWAMALAHVPGRASSSTIGVWFGTSRQNVDNASERYLRARDGDDPDDFLAGEGPARVIERGRARRAKAATTDLWAAEARFTALLAGPDERKRA